MICSIALLIVLTSLQDKSIAAVVREVPGDGAGGRPRIVCEGTVDLPEGSLLDLRIYYGPFEPGRDLQYRTVQVRTGAFSRDFFIFPEKNLAGPYVLKVAFDPTRQSKEVRDVLGPEVRPWSRTLQFRIGTSREGEEDRLRVLDRLAREIRAIAALADDLETNRRSAQRSPVLEAWSITERACRTPEYKALRLDEVSGAGLLDLYNRLKEIAAGRSVRPAFDRVVQRHLDSLAAEQIGGEALANLAEELRGRLKKAAGLSGESLEAIWKEFTAALLTLQVKAPARHHAALVSLASDAVALLDESCPTEERERIYRQACEPKILRLMEEFKSSRWE